MVNGGKMTLEEFYAWLGGFIDAVGPYENVTVDQWEVLLKKYGEVEQKVTPTPVSPLQRNPYDVFGPQYPFKYPLTCNTTIDEKNKNEK